MPANPHPHRNRPVADSLPARVGRREFVQSALKGSLALALAAALPARLISAVSAAPAPAPSAGQADSTRRMAALLKRINREGNPMLNAFRNAERAELLHAAASKAADLQTELGTRVQAAYELLQAGNPAQALAE